jgi:hypothetical protein
MNSPVLRAANLTAVSNLKSAAGHVRECLEEGGVADCHLAVPHGVSDRLLRELCAPELDPVNVSLTIGNQSPRYLASIKVAHIVLAHEARGNLTRPPGDNTDVPGFVSHRVRHITKHGQPNVTH